LLDVLVAMFGELPRAVQASTSAAGIDDSGKDAIVAVSFEFSRGRIATLLQNRLSQGAPRYFDLRADTEQASWNASFGGRARMIAGLHRSSRPTVRFEYGRSGVAWRETTTGRTLVARNPGSPNAAATRVVLDRTFSAFRDGSEPPTSGAQARRLLEVVDLCYESAATGRRISFNESGEK
jgi:predicted dehydrogenase